MSIMDIFKVKQYKEKISVLEKEADKVKSLEEEIDKLKSLIDNNIYKHMDMEEELKKLDEKKVVMLDEIKSLDDTINIRKKELINIDEEKSLEEHGVYQPKYNLVNSEAYAKRLKELRDIQKSWVKEKKAVDFTEWTVNGSKKEGKAMTNDMIKLTLRSFNNECDNIIMKVKFNNVEASKSKVIKLSESLNKLGRVTNVKITRGYLELKIKELELAYEYECEKQEEKEEQARIKEQMKEEARVLREIEREKEKITKEEKHFNHALSKFEEKLESVKNQEEKDKIISEIETINEKLQHLDEVKEDVMNREKNTRAGYVYIISNIGSFGEDVYKIGMTRRLAPYDRVNELGSASVPFKFDVHAMIFSEDAPTLENELHKRLDLNRVNKVNNRKEFFKVNIDVIKSIVEKEHGKVVEFTKLAEASEYRQSIVLEKKVA